ncbi:putative succinyl-CoA transferase [Streptomyces sulfonofaciens]|uniref:Succinyl-CoA transferase n=1 Tax=Streptomyces sulfonofaciens TaxID=68272 RepID=A0A919L611_9ACTN|nr:GNAT family N-acetyltransferase [Streptomyces sulfonofaciens]GHH86215.1 putative succinyl-CoA transferase [Streptomyces sulfonofaciens]
MLSPYWPLEGLRVVGGPVELRYPVPSDLARFAAAGAREPYLPSVPMFAVRSDTPEERGRRTLQYFWQEFASWRPGHWALSLTVLHEGEPVGSLNVRARDFAQVREVATGSWIFGDRRGAGLGSRARAALLHLVFEGLGARYALSTTAVGNAASLRVSEKLGYERDGTERVLAEDEVVPMVRLRLSAERHRERATPDGLRVEGLDACRPLFGLA